MKIYEYISYITDPDLSISKLAQMTTCIPFLFIPIKYKDNLYLDGGIQDSFPIDNSHENYLGLLIYGGMTSMNTMIEEYFPLLKFMKNIHMNLHEISLKAKSTEIDNIIYYDINLGLNFSLSEKEKEIYIQKAYDTTINHIHTYQLTNDILQKS